MTLMGPAAREGSGARRHTPAMAAKISDFFIGTPDFSVTRTKRGTGTTEGYQSRCDDARDGGLDGLQTLADRKPHSRLPVANIGHALFRDCGHGSTCGGGYCGSAVV